MKRIIPIPKEEIKYYFSKTIRYFKEVIPQKKSTDMSFIKSKFQSAKETICIVSTSDINTDIIKELYPLIDKNVRVYIIVSSFNTCKNTVDQFGKTKPALIRQVSDIKNNFIVIDNKGYFCTNSLAKDENHFIELDTDYSKDLSYWFSYYFWNKASKEKMVDKIQDPLPSPYPPFDFTTEYIKEANNETATHDNCIVPNNSKYASLTSLKCNNISLSLSREIDNPIYMHKTGSSIGDLFISNHNLSDHIGSQWVLMEGKQGDVSEPIIPFDSKEWNHEIRIERLKQFEIGNISVKVIEDMESCKPNKFPVVPYVNQVHYKWTVMPPYKPSGVTKAKLYEEYNRLQREFEKVTDELRIILESIKNEKSQFIDFLSRRKRKAEERLNQIEDWGKSDLKKRNFNNLKDFVNEEFPKFYQTINDERKELNLDIKKKEQEEKWNKEKEKKEEQAKAIQSKLDDINNKISNLEELKNAIEKTSKDKDIGINNHEENLKKLKKEKQYTCRKLDSLNHELHTKYEEFIFKPEQSELAYTKKNRHHSGIQLSCPKYPLPEVGELFEDSNSYYLEIEHYEEVSKANEIANNRYIDKTCHVVAKERK